MAISNVAKLVLAFVTLIVGLALISQVVLSSASTVGLTSTSESVAVTANESGKVDNRYGSVVTHYTPNDNWREDSSDCSIADPVVTNCTGVTLTDTTDYVWYHNGSINFENTRSVNCTDHGLPNATTVYYSYCPDSYMTIGWGRTVINLVPGFFAQAMLFVSLGLFYSLFKDSGLIG